MEFFQAGGLRLILCIFSAGYLCSGCNNNAQRLSELVTFAAQVKPASMSVNASLINFGSDENPVLVWAEYLGPLAKNGGLYLHIHAIRYFLVGGSTTDIVYYEHAESRYAGKSFNFQKAHIHSYLTDYTIQLSADGEEILLFRVLYSDLFDREYNGLNFTTVHTVARKKGLLVSDHIMEISLQQTDDRSFEVTLLNGAKLRYKAHLPCAFTNQKISYLNRETGRIYFDVRDCYLDLEKVDDVRILQTTYQ